ncbi:hypothetical protein H8356DRAFT_1358558 [Neocallimastix lanati (nom. inval.)]|nr:hypothetical protein H8356DRAFT_1358558 [Neocallimastix sp. JGI-2020a]
MDINTIDFVIINGQPTLQTTSILAVHSRPSNSKMQLLIYFLRTSMSNTFSIMDNIEHKENNASESFNNYLNNLFSKKEKCRNLERKKKIGKTDEIKSKLIDNDNGSLK